MWLVVYTKLPPQDFPAGNMKEHRKLHSAEPVTEPRSKTGPQEQKTGMSLTHSRN